MENKNQKVAITKLQNPKLESKAKFEQTLKDVLAQQKAEFED